MNARGDRSQLEQRLTRALTESAARMVRDDEPPPVLLGRRPARPWQRRSLPPLLAAAAIAAIVTGITLATQPNNPDEPRPAGPASPTPTASSTLNSPAPSRASASRAASHERSHRAPVGLAGCLASQLDLTRATWVGLGGHALTTYYLTNTGTAACTLTGYPGVAILDASGSIVQRPAVREPGPGTTQQVPVRTVRLRPGGQARFLVSSVDTVPNPDCPASFTGTRLQVYPPNQTTAIYLPGTYHFCDLAVGPVQPVP